jgi:hypothetical protein
MQASSSQFRPEGQTHESIAPAIFRRVGWTLWAVLPVLALAYHFGPGQSAFKEDLAADVISRAQDLQSEAVAAQELAYEKHLVAITARRAAFGKDDPALNEAARVAGEAEDAAYAVAGELWKRTADELGQAQDLIEESEPEFRNRVRLARARALVRSGDIGAGADDLEALLESLAEQNAVDSRLGLEARQELATALYYGARLLRLAGKPAAQWREVSGRSRQHFRYLAEHGRASGVDQEAIANHEKNGELVLNLEQSSLDELYAQARPKDSPPGAGSRLGEPRPGRRGRRPGDEPNQGAGLDGEIGQGW